MKKYPDHEYAQLFPMAEPDDRKRIRDDIEENGQLEKIVLLDGKVLDGRNRQEVMIEDLGIEPEYAKWEDLPESLTRNGALAYVLSRNLARRHLSVSVRAIIAAEALPYIEKEAEQRKRANLRQNRENPPKDSKESIGDSELNQDTGARPEDESQERRRGPKSVAIAGAQFGVSGASVARAKRLLATDPAKLAEVKAGKKSLTAATRDADREQKKAQELEDAHKRIGTVCGRTFAAAAREGKILKKRSEVIGFAELSDEDMLKVRHLIGAGWSLARATSLRMTRLARTHSIGDLCTRAIAQGVATTGVFSLEIDHEGVPLEITVRRRKPADVTTAAETS